MKRKIRFLRKFLHIILPLFFLMKVNISVSQNQEVTIIAPYQPTISGAQKLSVNPALTDTVIKVPELSYSIASRPVFTSYITQTIKPTLVDVETGQVLRRNYLKAGFGNYSMPYFELFANNLQSKKYAVGFHARHLSSQGKIEDYPNSAFGSNAVSLNFKRYLNEKIVSGDFFYNRDVVNYYGFKPAEFVNDSIADDDLRQRFSLFGFNAGFASNHRSDMKTNYTTRLKFYHLSDLFETSEFNAGLFSNVNTQNDFLDLADNQELGADFDFDYYHNSDSLHKGGTIALHLKPYLKLNFGYLDLTLGAGLALAADSSSRFFLFPDIKASFEVLPGYLRFYLSASGDLHRNSYRHVVGENLWANNLFPLDFTFTKYNLKGGITGKINMLIDYNFDVSYSEIENMLFYVNDWSSPFSPEISVRLGNKFTGIYDNATITAVNLEAGYRQSRFFKALLKGTIRNYNLENQEHPWHKPVIEIVLSGKYLLTNDISIGGDIFYSGKTYAQVMNNGNLTTAENSGFLDLNLNAEYRFSENISAFAQVNNILATRYYRYYNYPSQRINAMAGFVFAF
jgi:hypothetical protein